MPIRFDTATGLKVWHAKLPPTDDSWAQHLTGLAMSPDGKVIVAAFSNSGGPFLLLDAATGAVVGRLKEPAADWCSAAFSNDGKWIATAGSWLRWQSDGRFSVETVVRWPKDPRSRWADHLVDHSGDPIDRLKFDPLPDLGPYIVEEWSVVEGRIKTLQFEPPPRERLVSAPDGRILIGFDPETPERSGLRLYEMKTGRVLREYSDDEPCRSAAFTPDGRFLLTDHPATGIRIWNVRQFTERTPR